nr:translocase of chloroplast 34, chloroplastic [Tanacetum cinerariifolium]
MCGTKVCEEQKQNMKDTMLELLEDCQQKELYYMHSDAEDLIGSAINSKLLLINLKSQRLDKEKQFSGELAHIDLVPSRINKVDFDPEEEIHLIEELLYENSSPRLPKELNAEIADTILESLSPSLIPIENRDIYFLEKLLSDDPLPLLEKLLSDDPPPPKPPDVEIFFDFEPNTGVLTAKVVEDISEHYVLIPKVLPSQPALCPNIDTLLPFSSENEDKVFKPACLRLTNVSVWGVDNHVMAYIVIHCLATDGNTFLELRDNIQGYVIAAAVNYNQGNSVYRPSVDQDSLNSAAGGNLLERRTQDVLTIIKNKSKCLATDGNTFLELRDNIQGYVIAASVNYNQGNSVYRPSGSGYLPSNTIANPKGELTAITTRSGIVLDGPSVPIPPLFINPEEDERVEETLTDHDLIEYTIKVPPPLVHNPSLLLKETCCASKGSSSPQYPLSFKDFTFPTDFVIIDYESDPRVPLILGRPFLWSAHALIDVHGEETILRDGDERLTLNMRHDTS